eukprot:1156804-Pelagomonas_calceolata.AAC.10
MHLICDLSPAQQFPQGPQGAFNNIPPRPKEGGLHKMPTKRPDAIKMRLTNALEGQRKLSMNCAWRGRWSQGPSEAVNEVCMASAGLVSGQVGVATLEAMVPGAIGSCQ